MLEIHRKTPIQQRALHTIDLILTAAEELIEREGEAGFTTNHIAREAGFSIGTLYQYFPNKTSIIEALALREVTLLNDKFDRAIRSTPAEDQEAVLRAVVAALLSSFAGRREVHRFALLQIARMGHLPRMFEALDRLWAPVIGALQREDAHGRRPLSAIEAFIVTRALSGLIRAAIMEQRKVIDDPAFARELVTLAMGYLKR